ncbi:MAG: hypothetical protein AB1571_03565 [Nanoarchaeota archaeon]
MPDINKLLIITLVIVVAAASVSYFQGSPDLTGQVTGTKTKISVSPTYVGDAREVTIKITPGSAGAGKYIYVYAGGEGTIGTIAYRKEYCRGSDVCRTPKTYKLSLSSTDQGEMTAAVRDCNNIVNPLVNCNNDGEFIRAYFTAGVSKQLRQEELSSEDPILVKLLK